MFKFIRLYRLRVIQVLILIAITLGSYVFLNHNMRMYQQPIATVVAVKHDQQSKVSDQFDNQVTQHEQIIQAKLDNGKNRGSIVQLMNSADSAQGISQVLHVNDKIFLQKGDDGIWQFSTMKRDQFWIPLLVLVLGILLILMGKTGRLTAISLLVNVLLFTFTIYLDLQLPNGNIFWLFIGFAIVASIFTLGLVLGIRTKLMWAVTVTVLSTTLLAMLITNIVFTLTNNNGLHLELMEYITQLPKPLFYAMTLVGILGAVMDEATDMIATLFALMEENPHISLRALVEAGRRVGQEIFGALTNVLFLIFIAEQIPMVILYLHNGNTWSFTYMQNLSLGMIQTLISAIAIVLTVPVGIFWVVLLKKFVLKGRLQ